MSIQEEINAPNQKLIEQDIKHGGDEQDEESKNGDDQEDGQEAVTIDEITPQDDKPAQQAERQNH